MRALAVYVSMAILAVTAACQKKTASSETVGGVPAEVEQAAQALPEGTNVLAAMGQKDYDTAVSTLLKIQQTSGEELQPSLMVLRQHVRGALIDASETDPKAAEALNGIRAMMTGR